MRGFLKDLFSSYQAVAEVGMRYWKNYGGWWALLLSPYLHFSILVSAVSFPYSNISSWYDLPINVLPSLIGFTLGGYAIFLAFGDDKFKKVIAGTNLNETKSVYLEINTTFIHFIILQLIALLMAIIAKPLPYNESQCLFYHTVYILSFLGHSIFIYALLTAVATVLSIYRFVSMYNQFLQIENQRPNEIITKLDEIVENLQNFRTRK